MVFDIVVHGTILFKIVFRLKMHRNRVFLFLILIYQNHQKVLKNH